MSRKNKTHSRPRCKWCKLLPVGTVFFVFLMKRLLPLGSRNILRSTVSFLQINTLFVSNSKVHTLFLFQLMEWRERTERVGKATPPSTPSTGSTPGSFRGTPRTFRTPGSFKRESPSYWLLVLPLLLHIYWTPVSFKVSSVILGV